MPDARTHAVQPRPRPCCRRAPGRWSETRADAPARARRLQRPPGGRTSAAGRTPHASGRPGQPGHRAAASGTAAAIGGRRGRLRTAGGLPPRRAVPAAAAVRCPARGASEAAAGRRRPARRLAGQTDGSACGQRSTGRCARGDGGLHPQHRRTAHRAGRLGAGPALRRGRRCGHRRADAQAAARPGIPGAGIGLARCAVADPEPGTGRDAGTAPVRRQPRRAARRHRERSGPAGADRAASRAGRPLAQCAGRPGLDAVDRPVQLRAQRCRHRAAGGVGPDLVAGRRPFRRRRRPGPGRRRCCGCRMAKPPTTSSPSPSRNSTRHRCTRNSSGATVHWRWRC